MCEDGASLSTLWVFMVATTSDPYMLVTAICRLTFAVVPITVYLIGNWHHYVSYWSYGRKTSVIGITLAFWEDWEC